MAKITMHKELEMLRDEVEELRREKAERIELEQLEAKKREDMEREKVTKSAQKIKDRATEVEGELKEKIHEFSEAFKHDYENLSPVAAVSLFAIGAIFGHAISSK